MRLLAAVGFLAMFVLGCPTSSAERDPGAEARDSGDDAGVPGPSTGSTALASDGGLAFAVGSTVYFERNSNDWIYLFESTSARAAFCDERWPEGHSVVLFTEQELVQDGTYAIPGGASGLLELADGGSWYATEGQLTASLHGAPVTAVTGSFAMGGFDYPSVLPGSLTGTFEAHRCESRPWVDGGTGANSASGTLGFEARSTIGFADSAGRFDLYVLSREFTVDDCPRGPGTDLSLLRLAFERVGTGATESFEVRPLVVSRWDVLPDGSWTDALHAREGTLTANFADGGVSGTYEAGFLGPNGALESIQGSFDAILCP